MAGANAVFEPIARSLLRIVAGFTFSLHGMQKIFGLFGGMGGHPVPFGSLIWVAGMLELVGGLLLVLGLFTSPVAFVVSGKWPWPTSGCISRTVTCPSLIMENWRRSTALYSCTSVLPGQGRLAWTPLSETSRIKQACLNPR